MKQGYNKSYISTPRNKKLIILPIWAVRFKKLFLGGEVFNLLRIVHLGFSFILTISLSGLSQLLVTTAETVQGLGATLRTKNSVPPEMTVGALQRRYGVRGINDDNIPRLVNKLTTWTTISDTNVREKGESPNQSVKTRNESYTELTKAPSQGISASKTQASRIV